MKNLCMSTIIMILSLITQPLHERTIMPLLTRTNLCKFFFKIFKRDARWVGRGDASWAICLGQQPVAFNVAQQGEESWKVLHSMLCSKVKKLESVR
jgi:hypothetical protein